ncbi:PEP-CTERM sorting domain-containing protein [Nostoc sp. CHAB 5824]|nr:PEP-CTERM sorting domain-containing protein [Nostoc sp. CHAB 5824]
MIKNNRIKAVAQAISTVVALSWVIMQVESAQAATLTVNNLDDSGVGSLRDTINIANNNDVVELLLGSHPNTITLTSGALAIAKNLTINGPSANLLTIGSNNHFPVFEISAADVRFSGLAIAGNFNAYNSSNLTFINSTVSGDNFKIDSNLKLINSTISSNNIEINANDVTLTDHSQLVSSNNIEINTSQLNVQDYSNIGTPNGITNGGTLSISTGNLGLNNNGQINAGSNNSKAGGDITITAHSIFLRDGSQLTIPTSTVNGNSEQISDGLGGNISLRVDDLLLLKPVPKPSALAKLAVGIAGDSNESGLGGNISINTNFIVGLPAEPSTSANGSNNSGAAGSITVTASGIVLTKVPEPSAIAGTILASSLAWLAKRKQAAFRKAKI